jgi:hypothetical protein
MAKEAGGAFGRVGRQVMLQHNVSLTKGVAEKDVMPKHNLRGQGQSVFRSFNQEPTATATNGGKCAVAVGSGLNEIYPRVKN